MSPLPYRFIEDAPTADVGFVATGDTLAACFRAAADATLAVMLGNPAALQATERRPVCLEAPGPDLALLRLLEEIIFYKDAERLFLRVEALAVGLTPERCEVTGTLAGEPIDPARHELAADVKAVTVHRLRVEQAADGSWTATVVLDI